MNFSSMDYFVMVARERSFSRAAERLHITQQTLSAHIAKLEGELGAKLLVRSIPLELTYAGEVFLEYALDFQRRASSLEREFQDITKNQRGLFQVGVGYTRGDILMPPLLARFQKQYPRIDLRLVGGNNSDFFPLLENGELDVAIGIFSTGTPELEVIDFYREEIVLLVPKSVLQDLGLDQNLGIKEQIRQGNLSSLAACPFLLASENESNGKLAYGLLRQSGIVPRPKIESRNSTSKTQLLLSVLGLGACFVPENMVYATLSPEQQSRLQIFHLGESAQYIIRIAYLKLRYHWRVLEDFIRLAQEMSGEFAAKK